MNRNTEKLVDLIEKEMRRITEKLVDLIEKEMRRIGVAASETNVSGYVVVAEDDLPEGWVRVYDDMASTYGLAVRFLEILEEIEDGDREGFWEGIDGFRACPPEAVDLVWSDYHEFIGLSDERAGLGVVAFHTNGGLKFGFAPTDMDYSEFNATHDFSDRYDTAREALDAALEFQARQEDDDR
jgi:hypothetical protein